MACIISFDNNATTGLLNGNPASNGTWEYLGYSTTEGGTYTVNGDFSATYNYGDNEDAASKPEGWYKFLYKSTLPDTDPCYGEIEIILPIVQGTSDMPADKSISLCSGDGVINLAGQFDTAIPGESSILPAATTVTGTALSLNGYANGGTPNDPLDDTVDTSVGPYPASGDWVITKTPQAPAGYTLSNCDNCQVATSTLSISITQAFDPGTPANIAVCSDS